MAALTTSDGANLFYEDRACEEVERVLGSTSSPAAMAASLQTLVLYETL